MSSWKELGISSYPEYLKSQWWHDLKEDILFKRDAKCYVCGEWSRLILHHVNYASLGNEKLGKDIFILCPSCHTKCHFWTHFHLKVPLRIGSLLFSLRMRKQLYYVQHGRFGLSALWFLFLIFSGLSAILFYLLERGVLLSVQTFWIITKYCLSFLRVDIE